MNKSLVLVVVFTVFSFALPAFTTATEPSPHITILVAYYSVTGNTEKMAQGVVDGVKGVKGTDVVMKRVGQVTEQDLFLADAVVVGSPVYWSNMAGEVKTFFD